MNFVVGRHDAGGACSNGWARPVYDTDTGAAVLELHDYSVLGRSTGEPRTYRVSNVRALALGGTFARPKGFELGRYWSQSTERFEGELYHGSARLRVNARG